MRSFVYLLSLLLLTGMSGCGLRQHAREAAAAGLEFVQQFHASNLDHVYYSTSSQFRRLVEIDEFRDFANQVRDKFGSHMSSEPLRVNCSYTQRNPVCEVHFQSNYSRSVVDEAVTVEIALDRGRGVHEVLGYRIGDVRLRAKPLNGDTRA